MVACQIYTTAGDQTGMVIMVIVITTTVFVAVILEGVPITILIFKFIKDFIPSLMSLLLSFFPGLF